MSGHGGAEKSETSIVAFVGIFFIALLALCGLEFADNVGKNELLPAGGHISH